MQLHNATSMPAAYTLGLCKDATECLVVVVKGTFDIITGDLVPKQAPLVMADTFEGKPGLSAPVYESDFPYTKPRCDVVFVGSAYAPGGRPIDSVQASISFGPIHKKVVVYGDRVWEPGAVTAVPGSLRPFTVQPFSYGSAFGGIDSPRDDEKSHATFLPNPIGRGFHARTPSDRLLGKPLPNVFAPGELLQTPQGKCTPVALGPIGRGWLPRYKLAGTYDQKWIDERFPFLPDDFDEAYFQCSPPDQQVPYPTGGEEVTLLNLAPTPRLIFKVPTLDLPIAFKRRKETSTEVKPVIDTIIIEPDLSRFCVVWRACFPLKRNILEGEEVVVGRMSRAWYRARELGKTYFPSISALAKHNKESAEANT